MTEEAACDILAKPGCKIAKYFGARKHSFVHSLDWSGGLPQQITKPCRRNEPAGPSQPTGHGQERREAAAGVEGRRGDLPPPPLLHRHLRRPDLLQQGKSLLNPSRPLGVCLHEPGPIPRRLVAGEEKRVLWCCPNAFESGRFSLETNGRPTYLSSVAWDCSW
jgi:hypothetical protein